ncbi:hypothetical protein EU92_0048 [Prochlorococcus marinus str. MIT 9107]|uniref:Uncharacterized protein n=1 Tax=Prochlorococcus marinus str. MIT 9116 TaxID=167544 RepID=A0A0A1ZVE3_PROMR|nr:hypothetical protein EU92_0048 [Prochlorococcus marinus str. MIT 9107]KGF92249.1 hypothetical protein EU93_0794 [Prochlorococcus marinus str. MIT 9116]KGF94328.1 hypothetical protein EU94_0673 [Prochlorococcus marinus str. MIT 9123]
MSLKYDLTRSTSLLAFKVDIVANLFSLNVSEGMKIKSCSVNNTIKKCKVKQKNPHFYKNENKYLVNLAQ